MTLPLAFVLTGHRLCISNGGLQMQSLSETTYRLRSTWRRHPSPSRCGWRSLRSAHGPYRNSHASTFKVDQLISSIASFSRPPIMSWQLTPPFYLLPNLHVCVPYRSVSSYISFHLQDHRHITVSVAEHAAHPLEAQYYNPSRAASECSVASALQHIPIHGFYLEPVRGIEECAPVESTTYLT